MIKLIYEDDYANTTITYECDAVSLEGSFDTLGVSEHIARFLRAAGYPIEHSETLIPFDPDRDVLIERKEWDDLHNMLDELTAELEGTKKTDPLSQDDWIPWHGGECPVDNGVRVDARLRNGEMQNDTPAGGWNWTHMDDDFDIIAYRVVEEDA